MLESLYIFYSIVAFFFLSLGYYFYNKRFESVLFFTISTILFGIMIFAGLTIENVIGIYNVSTGTMITESVVHVNYAMIGLNIIFFALSMIFFVNDLYTKLPDILGKNIKKGIE